MILIIGYIIGVLFYCGLPWYLQFVVLLFNTFIPDPVPYLDEIIMYASFVKKVVMVDTIVSFVKEHPILTGILIIIGVCGLVSLFL